jgi:hypothetical protein
MGERNNALMLPPCQKLSTEKKLEKEPWLQPEGPAPLLLPMGEAVL